MKFVIIMMSIALVAPSASAQRAIVKAQCPAPVVYVQSFPSDGSTGAPPASLAPNTTFSEDLHLSNSTIKIDTDKALAHPLVVSYFFSSDSDDIFCEGSWGTLLASRTTF
ncbi:hypothetical protein GGR53DRAFT_516942 [Hypoxylon sp. FL1150]|nr:hypothetical protein GGR53DRAFT_516942 [Hypoxylon sp. FL1150]